MVNDKYSTKSPGVISGERRDYQPQKSLDEKKEKTGDTEAFDQFRKGKFLFLGRVFHISKIDFLPKVFKQTCNKFG